MKIVDVYVDPGGWGIQVIVEIRPERYPGTLMHHIVTSEPCWPIFVCIGDSLLKSKEVRHKLGSTKEYYDRTKRLVLFSVDQLKVLRRFITARPFTLRSNHNLIQQQFTFIWWSVP